MPRFYFDFRDGDRFAEDDIGVELPHSEAVRHEIVRILPEVGKDTLPAVGGDRREIAVRVRDETGQEILIATLTLVVSLSV